MNGTESKMIFRHTVTTQCARFDVAEIIAFNVTEESDADSTLYTGSVHNPIFIVLTN